MVLKRNYFIANKHSNNSQKMRNHAFTFFNRMQYFSLIAIQAGSSANYVVLEHWVSVLKWQRSMWSIDGVLEYQFLSIRTQSLGVVNTKQSR